MRKNKRKNGGFEDDPRPIPCSHPSHQPPGHIVIPPGTQFRHICQGCKKETVIRPTMIRWSAP